MILTEGKGPVTSSYSDSICVLLPALFRSRSDLIFALLLNKIITITVVETTTLIIKAVASELIDIIYALLVSECSMPNVFAGCRMLVFTRIGSLMFPVIFPQTAVCKANTHKLPLVGTSVQVTVVWLMVVGQLPQFDARML